MSGMTPERLAEIEARANAATPGPWSAADEHGLLGPDAHPAWCVSQMRPGWESMSPTEGYITDVAETFSDDKESDPDAEFIAHARTDVPDLLDEVRRLQAAWSMAEPVLTERDALAAEVERLRRVATGEISHRYTGNCPDSLDGHDLRDPLCAACKVLARTDPKEVAA